MAEGQRALEFLKYIEISLRIWLGLSFSTCDHKIPFITRDVNWLCCNNRRIHCRFSRFCSIQTSCQVSKGNFFVHPRSFKMPHFTRHRTKPLIFQFYVQWDQRSYENSPRTLQRMRILPTWLFIVWNRRKRWVSSVRQKLDKRWNFFMQRRRSNLRYFSIHFYSSYWVSYSLWITGMALEGREKSTL